jgi:hypothetical protein
MDNVTKFWKLDSPKACRDFLKNVRIGEEGIQITELTQADGKVVSIDEASDEAIVLLVNEMASAMEGSN